MGQDGTQRINGTNLLKCPQPWYNHSLVSSPPAFSDSTNRYHLMWQLTLINHRPSEGVLDSFSSSTVWRSQDELRTFMCNEYPWAVLHTVEPACLNTVKPIFKTTWEIETTWELTTATSVPRYIHYVEMDLRNKATSEIRTVSDCPLGVPNSQLPLYMYSIHESQYCTCTGILIHVSSQYTYW